MNRPPSAYGRKNQRSPPTGSEHIAVDFGRRESTALVLSRDPDTGVGTIVGEVRVSGVDGGSLGRAIYGYYEARALAYDGSLRDFGRDDMELRAPDPASFADTAAAAIRGMQMEAAARLLYEVAQAGPYYVLDAPQRALLAEYRRLAVGDAATGRTWGDWHAENRPWSASSMRARLGFDDAQSGTWRVVAVRGFEEAADWAADALGLARGEDDAYQPRPPLVADARGVGTWSPPWPDEEGE